MPIKGSLIAATALIHGVALVTCNRSDFEKAGVRIVDPSADSAWRNPLSDGDDGHAPPL